MSTYQVPGHVVANADTLRVGCWAEHADGSLMAVMKMDADRVRYLVRSPNGENYEGELPTLAFQRLFSDGSGAFRWLWHDKTPFPAAKVEAPAIKTDFVSAAEKLAQDFSLRARGLSRQEAETLLT